MLSWTTSTLAQYQHAPLTFDETIEISKEMMERNPEIIKMGKVRVVGTILAARGDFVVTATVTAPVTLPSTRSLTPVDVDTEFTFNEIYLSSQAHIEDYEDDELLIPLDSEWLDLLPAVKDNFLLGLPLRVVSAEEETATDLPSGADWTLMREEDVKTVAPEDQPNNPFAELQGLFDNNEDDK